eukprot:gene2738-5390_t
MIVLLSFVFKILVFLSINDRFLGITCNLGVNHTEDYVPLYWINMDRSIDRRDHMVKHLSTLGLPNHRIRATTPADLDIPEDLLHKNHTCVVNAKSSKYIQTFNSTSNYSIYPITRIHITGLCDIGRKFKDRFKFISLTISHLVSIYTAIQSSNSTYAIITEDDINFAFNINFPLLIKSAPKDFSILQLSYGNVKAVTLLWDTYLQNSSTYWMHRNKPFFWSTGGYIINKTKLKPIIQNIMKKLPDGRLEMKIIAGKISPKCLPKQCCTRTGQFIHVPPCIYSKHGIPADHFIYSLGKTYTLTTPIMSFPPVSNNSTLKQDPPKAASFTFIPYKHMIKIPAIGASTFNYAS